MHFPTILTHCLCSFLLIQSAFSDSATVGINYGRVADNLPSPAQVVQLLPAQGITKVKIYDTDSTVLTAFSGSGISLTVAMPNEQLSSAAASTSFADSWVESNILPYLPNTMIEAIAVGNEVFVDPSHTEFLVPAMNNVYAALAKYDASSSIKISSPVALSALQTSYPSSAGAFKPELAEAVMKPMLTLLNQTDSYLMINVYPYFAYLDNTDTISLDYALFRDNAGNKDSNNGLLYNNLLDAQIDAVYAAMSALGFDDVKLVISETGWPSKGDEDELGVPSIENAAAYNGNLVRRVLTGAGTPLRPDEPLNVYLFALFNEDLKPGKTSENNYGLFYPNEQKVYDIPLRLNESKVEVAAAGQTWCVANEKAGEKKLQKALDYVCAQGGADCRPIQPGGTCYYPKTVEAHASYAVNSYYQKNLRRSGTCDFGGAAYVVTQPPKFGSCEFPTGY